MAEEQGGSSQEKTEDASDRKREDARKKGSVARSLELNSAIMIMFGLLIISFSASGIGHSISNISQSIWQSANTIVLTRQNIIGFGYDGAIKFFMMTMPFFVGLSVIGFGINVAQVGFLISAEALSPKWNRLNPLNGIKRLFFSSKTIFETVKNLIKLFIVGMVAFFAVRLVLNQTVLLMDSDIDSILSSISENAIAIGTKTAVAFLILSVFDFLYQRFEYEKEIKMTKQEVREESKMMDGDPHIKGKIRQIQRQIAYKRMMHDVPKADVVVTNPTHLAIALKYEVNAMNAPKVVAKGAELIAQRIKEVAKQHNIPIVEDKPLARALYKSVEIGEAIPEKLFQAVAQLLAYIYKMKNSNKRSA